MKTIDIMCLDDTEPNPVLIAAFQKLFKYANTQGLNGVRIVNLEFKKLDLNNTNKILVCAQIEEK